MKRVAVRRDGVVLVEVDRPEPKATEALVRTIINGVCGSDVHAAAGHHPFIALPYTPGHETVGIVTEVGDRVSEVRPGQRVVVEPTLPCWSCKLCRRGLVNLCESLRFFGCNYDQGGLADYFTLPVNRLHPVPDDLSDAQAVLVEPLATALHAVGLTTTVDGKTVVVQGAGTIGLLHLVVARLMGARDVLVTDPVPGKRERAQRFGASAALDPISPDTGERVQQYLGESPDFVFDCVSSQTTLSEAVHLVSKGGTVTTVGVPAASVLLALPQLQNRQIRLQGSATYTPADFTRAIDLVRERFIDPDDFITAQFSMDNAADAFAAAATGSEVKVVIQADEA